MSKSREEGAGLARTYLTGLPRSGRPHSGEAKSPAASYAQGWRPQQSSSGAEDAEDSWRTTRFQPFLEGRRNWSLMPAQDGDSSDRVDEPARGGAGRQNAVLF